FFTLSHLFTIIVSFYALIPDPHSFPTRRSSDLNFPALAVIKVTAFAIQIAIVNMNFKRFILKKNENPYQSTLDKCTIGACGCQSVYELTTFLWIYSTTF